MVRRGTSAVLALASIFGACHDQQWVRPVQATAVFDESALDFGDVPVGEWREAEITVRNAGNAPFTLVEALQLGDDPSYEVEAAQQMVPPWDTRAVRVRFHPVREGQIDTQVKIATDALHREEDPIPVRGVGTPAAIRFAPGALNFETLEIDSDRVLEVAVENPVDLPMTLSVQGDATSEFSADTITLPPLATTTVKARFAPNALGDRGARLEVLACPTCTPVALPLRGLSVPHAFRFKPTPVPFQDIPVHEISDSYTEMTNITWRPVTISQLVPNDISFSALTDLRNRTLAPGETVRLDLRFAARTSGPNVGEMDIQYTSDRARSAPLGLDARGGKPQLALAPILLDFGRLPVGGKARQIVRLTNAGVIGDLHFEGVTAISGNIDQFGLGAPRRGTQDLAWSSGAWPNVTAADLPIGPGADAIDVPVFFQPTAAGDFQATIRFRSDDVFNTQRDVVLKGTAYETGPCAWKVLPSPLDFGNVPAGTGSILGFRFENAGTNICAVKDIHISNDGGGVFWMPGGSLTGGVVLKDDAFSAMIAFRSATPGEFLGELVMTVSDPANPTVRLPLKAVAGTSCLVAAPGHLDFGPVRYDCAPEPRTTFVSNACTTPVTVTGVRIGEGTSDQFHLSPLPQFPLTLAPGQGFEVEATYDRTDLGQHYSPIFVSVSGEPLPFLVPMWAETNHEGTAVDRFVQGKSNELDVLFVVSNTTTMEAHQRRLQDAIPGWVASAQAQGISLRVGVTSTGLITRSASCPGGALGGEAGRLFPVDGSRARYVDATAATSSIIQQNLAVGVCHNLVQGLETMRMALSSPLVDGADDPRTAEPLDGNRGFLRDSARLAVVFVADEDDHSGFDPVSYARFLDGLKGPNMAHRTEAYALVPKGGCVTAAPSAPRLEQVAAETGGTSSDVCGGYWGILSEVLGRASGPQASFELTYPVRSASEITVLVTGARTGGWTLEPTRNSVVFNTGAVPLPGDRIEVRYVADCSTTTR